MDNSALDSSESADFAVAAEMEDLARETDTPVEVVHAVYRRERAKLERNSRIKTYVPVLAHRHVKELLKERRISA